MNPPISALDEIDRTLAIVNHNAATAREKVSSMTLGEWLARGNMGISHREAEGLCFFFGCAPKHLEEKPLGELFAVPYHGVVVARQFGRWINNGRFQ